MKFWRGLRGKQDFVNFRYTSNKNPRMRCGCLFTIRA